MSTPSGWFQEPVRPTPYPGAHDLDPRRLAAQHTHEEDHGDGHDEEEDHGFHLHWKSDRERKLVKLSIFLTAMVVGFILGLISLPDWYRLAGKSPGIPMLLAVFGITGVIGLAIMLTNKKMGRSKLWWVLLPMFTLAFWFAFWMVFHYMEIPPTPPM